MSAYPHSTSGSEHVHAHLTRSTAAASVPPFYRLLAASPHQQPRAPYSISSLDHLPPARHSPSPPSASFLDRVLNPTHLAHNSSSPFPPNTTLASPYREPPSIADSMQTDAPSQDARPARLPNGYVDLTSTPDSPPLRRKRQSPTPGPSKRHKQEDGTAAKSTRKSKTPQPIDEIDLSDDKLSIHKTLQKQREDAIKLQEQPQDTPTTFNTITCVICMDTPTHLTATACGHLFCHTCLMEALIAGENRSGPGEPKRSQCPVCRKFINRSKTADIIPLLLKKGLATQPRKKMTTTAAKPQETEAVKTLD